MIPDYTIICGVDRKHLKQLEWVYPTWVKHKSSTLARPMLVFYDRDQLTVNEVRQAIPRDDLRTVPWPPEGIEYDGSTQEKFSHPQRYKMLAGFVHVPGALIKTPYFLKLDTDTVAIGNDDWIDPTWFDDEPVIISHPWSFTKPPDQMLKLDRWVECGGRAMAMIAAFPPLNLVPETGSERLGHKRIISWCGFFHTKFAQHCAGLASDSCGKYKLPVKSQDGFIWYVAKRTEQLIIRTSMKNRGWEHWTTEFNIRQAVERAMQ